VEPAGELRLRPHSDSSSGSSSARQGRCQASALSFSVGAVDDASALQQLINGYRATQAIHVAATLRIADLLADGLRSSDELATETDTHADTLYRLLRALASLGVLEEAEGRRFSLAARGELLRSDAPGTVAGWAAFVGRPYYWNAWGHLLHSVRTGENAMSHLLGHDVWELRVRNPEESEIFDRAMTDLTRVTNAAVVGAYDFGRFGVVVDVGGGRGALIGAVVERHPHVHGVLFDQPHVVEHAVVPEGCEVVAGSFFERVPEGGDAYVLKFIVHDWEDEENLKILRACDRAMGADGTLLVIERELGRPNEDPVAKLSDLNMLVGPGGRERTLDEYGDLFERAGFRLVGSTPTVGGLSVIEATPA
jgi:hypothetical protein